MITEIPPATESSEMATIAQNVNIADEIKRNHLQTAENNLASGKMKRTELTIKFARLKKALRKRSSDIF